MSSIWLRSEDILCNNSASFKGTYRWIGIVEIRVRGPWFSTINYLINNNPGSNRGIK